MMSKVLNKRECDIFLIFWYILKWKQQKENILNVLPHYFQGSLQSKQVIMSWLGIKEGVGSGSPLYPTHD